MINEVQFDSEFTLECGAILPDITIAYHTFGNYKKGVTPVLWVCHALTANSDVSDWWANIFGKGLVLDPSKYFIVCANNLGSCYGSTSSISTNPETNEKYGSDFPLITIRDMVKAHIALRKYLEIDEIEVLIGGSQGAQQCMEWAIEENKIIKKLVLIATNPKHSAWGIAFNEAQRMAIELGEKGILAARAMAMLSYRNYDMYNRTELVDDAEKLENYGASGYQKYQAEKLAKRFDADCYYTLSKAMDSHNVGRKRGGIGNALSKINAKTLVIGISSDLLFPIQEQKILASLIPVAELEIITSPYGHDGFLTEGEK